MPCSGTSIAGVRVRPAIVGAIEGTPTLYIPRTRSASVDLLEYLKRCATPLLLGIVRLDCRPVPSEDETQQPARERSPEGTPSRGWMRWIRRTPRHTEPEPELATTPAGAAQRACDLRALPTLLDSSSLPNGVVELLIEDFEAPTRQLFDIHDGHVTLVEPGKCVPWASIAGPPTAWAMALGPERNTTGLQLTGDRQLARRVLAAPHRAAASLPRARTPPAPARSSARPSA